MKHFWQNLKIKFRYRIYDWKRWFKNVCYTADREFMAIFGYIKMDDYAELRDRFTSINKGLERDLKAERSTTDMLRRAISVSRPETQGDCHRVVITLKDDFLRSGLFDSKYVEYVAERCGKEVSRKIKQLDFSIIRREQEKVYPKVGYSNQNPFSEEWRTS